MNKNRNVALNDSQMGIYLECVSKERSTQYNVMFEYVFGKDTDARKLLRACDRVLAHYAAFPHVSPWKTAFLN